MTKPRSTHQGFSLLDMLVGMAILATGLLFILGVFPMGLDSLRQSKDRLVATQLAQAYMDQQRSRTFTQMAGGNYTDVALGAVNGQQTSATFSTSVDVEPSNLTAASKATITVQVLWSHKGTLRYVRLGAARARED